MRPVPRAVAHSSSRRAAVQPPGCGEVDAGRVRRIEHVAVQVHPQRRVRRQRRERRRRRRRPSEARAFDRLDLAGIEVARADQRRALDRQRRPGAELRMAPAEQHRERHAAEEPGRRGLGRVQVAVRVEPDQRQVGVALLQRGRPRPGSACTRRAAPAARRARPRRLRARAIASAAGPPCSTGTASAGPPSAAATAPGPASMPVPWKRLVQGATSIRSAFPAAALHRRREDLARIDAQETRRAEVLDDGHERLPEVASRRAARSAFRAGRAGAT